MSLNYLYNLLNEEKRKIDRINAQNAKYQAIVDKILRIYNEMQQAKSELTSQKREMNNFSEQQCALWKGNLWTHKCTNAIQESLVGCSYPKLINQVDANLDALNNAKTDYENRILHNYGILGDLGASINSLCNQIENWIN